MAITKTIIQNSNSRTTIKLVATAASDTSTLNLKAAVTLTSLTNLQFIVGSNGTATITRTGGSWVTDMPTPAIPGATTANAVQYYVDCTSTTGANDANKKVFSVIAVTAATITVSEDITVAETVASTGTTSYKSDVGFVGQGISGTPKVNIVSVKYSLGGSATITRTSTVLNLFGTWLALNDGFGLAENNTVDITTLFNTAGGTVILELAKIDGFDRQIAYRDL